MEDFFTVKQVARKLKKSPSTVQRLIRNREMKAIKIAGKYGIYLIPRSEFLTYMMSKMSAKIAKATK